MASKLIVPRVKDAFLKVIVVGTGESTAAGEGGLGAGGLGAGGLGAGGLGAGGLGAGGLGAGGLGAREDG